MRITYALTLATVALAFPNPHSDSHMDMDMNMNMDNTTQMQPDGPMSYFAYGKHSSSIIAHIALMVAGWCFILPIGKRQQTNQKKVNQADCYPQL